MNVQAVIHPRADNGATTYRNISLLATGQLIKAGQSCVFGYFIANNAASVRYLKFYDKVSAPTVGTDTPLLTIPLPANSAANFYLGPGIQFTSGVGIGATNLIADSDTTAPTANDVVVNIFYK